MKDNKLRILYLAILIISLIAAAMLVWNRHRAEETSKTIELVADYEEFALLAAQVGKSETEIFRILRDAGFRSVALKEDTLYQLSEDGFDLDYDIFRNFRRDADWRRRLPAGAARDLDEQGRDWDVVVRVSDGELFARLTRAISARYDESFYRFYEAAEDRPAAIVLRGSADDLLYYQSFPQKNTSGRNTKGYRLYEASILEDIGLGYDELKIEAIRASGLLLHLRPTNYQRSSNPARLVSAYIADVEKYGALRETIIFQGSSVLSYQLEANSYHQSLYDYMRANRVSAGMIEGPDQLGFTESFGSEQLARDLEFDIVRVYPVVEYIQKRYNYLGYYEKSKEIENTLYRAVTDRNIRLIYFRPYKATALTYFEDLGEYKVMVDRLKQRLVQHGLTIGAAHPMQYNHVNKWVVLAMSYGVLVFGILILKLVFGLRGRAEWILLGLGIVGIAGALKVVPGLAVTALAFAATIVFPMLSAVFLVEYMKEMLLSRKVERTGGLVLRALIGFLVAVAISFVGGLYVAGYLSRQDYLVEISYFRGVKASLMLPIVLTLVLYIVKLGFRRTTTEGDTAYYEDIKHFLFLDVKLYFLLIAGALGLVAYLYLARSGNTSSVEVLDAELKLRIFLEDHLIARPRTKEIFLAYPALFAALFFAARGYKRLVLPFLLAGMVGISSILNTFCHSRTPVYLSIYRNLIAFGISIVTGVVIVFVLERIHQWFVRHGAGRGAELPR